MKKTGSFILLILSMILNVAACVVAAMAMFLFGAILMCGSIAMAIVYGRIEGQKR